MYIVPLKTMRLPLLLAFLLLTATAGAQTPDTTCGMPGEIVVSRVTSTSAVLSWDISENAESYYVTYGYHGAAQDLTTTTLSLSVTLSNLSPGQIYDVSVSAVCSIGALSEPRRVTIYTPCSNDMGDGFCYWNLHSPSVECFYGYGDISNIGVLDTGNLSRHTVLNDTSERDIFTLDQLRTIPQGYCYSVKLGNRNVLGEWEKIVYSVHVDTNQMALLILRFAMVQQNPSHGPSEQPYFKFSIRDENGNLLDPCYNANFIAGDNSGWNIGGSPTLVWHDWMSVGVDLTPYHDQEIYVHLENRDCALGAHFGYAYFVMETQKKQLYSNNCGIDQQFNFEAPEGFNYRWYNANDPGTTLSVTRFLNVTEFGTYCCRMGYTFTNNQDCACILTARAGPRYPVARFTHQPNEDCGLEVSFTNQSRIATDSTLSHLTEEGCSEFFWEFDDGGTSTQESPTHRFRSEGLHWARLTAMLGGGRCSHSVRDTFTLSGRHNILYDTACPGIPYQFHDTILRDSGLFSTEGDCGRDWIRLAYYDTPHSIYDTTMCHGDTLWHSGRPFMESGSYYILFPGTGEPGGCDSVERVDLTVNPTYFVRIKDTLPVGELYTVGETTIYAPGTGGYTFQTVDGCDSVVWLRLSCIKTMDSTVCVDDLPLVWDGITFPSEASDTAGLISQALTDSIIVRSLHVRRHAHLTPEIFSYCDMPQHYVVTLPTDNFSCSWITTPPVEPERQEILDSIMRLHFRPPVETRLSLLYDYYDAPSCPESDTVTLFPQRMFFLHLDVQPETLTSDNLRLVARDMGDNVSFRQWVVDSVLQAGTGARMEYDASPTADSVVVVLIGGDSACVDTARRMVPVIREDLFFPNVFTPGNEENNCFRVLGSEVEDFELWIYDRRGMLVFHATDRSQAWDGTCNGIPCIQGSYAYICHYTIPGNQHRTRSGTVTLLR